MSRLPLQALAFLVPLLFALAGCRREAIVIGVLEPDQGEAVTEARTGLLEGLRDAGYKGGENVRFVRRNAEVRGRTLDRLAVELRDDEKSRVLLAISTPALEAAVRAGAGVPVIFAMSGDATVAGHPPGASAAAHLPYVTGAVAAPPTADVVALVRRMLPQATRLGMLYVPGDADSLLGWTLAQRAASAAGIEASAEGVEAAPSARAATEALLRRQVQAILLSPGPALDGSFPTILKLATDAGVPVFGWTQTQAQSGALASMGVDPRDNGRRAGALAARVLRGESIAQVPVDSESRVRFWVNQRTAARLGVLLAPEVVAQAEQPAR